MNTERPDNPDRDDAVTGEAGAADSPGASDSAGAAERPLDTAGPAETAPADASTADPTEAEADAEAEAEAEADAEAEVEAGTETPEAPDAAEPSDARRAADAPEAPQDTAPAADGERAENHEPAAAAEPPKGLPSPAPALSAGDDPDEHTVRLAARASGEAPSTGGRRRSPLVAASVAAAVLLVAGGGAYLAASAADRSGGETASGAAGGDGTPPPLPIDGYSEGGGEGIAPGEPNPYGAVYRASGELPDGPGSAAVFRARGQVDKAEVARLAAALGVEGTPVLQGRSWRIGAKDGFGPTLQVNLDAPGTWTFHRYAPGTDNCKSTTECPQRGPMAPADDPVSEEAAKKAAAPVLKAVGQDDAKVDASQVMGAQRVVNADPVIGGLPTYGWMTGLTIGVDGEVVGGSGQLEAPVKGDTYPVLGAGETLEQMNAGQTGQGSGVGGCASPVPLEDGTEPVAPCEPEPARPQEIEVRDAVFGLASHYVGARQTLVPSWLFEVRAPGAQDSFTVTHPAVEPRFLVAPTPVPSDVPPGEPTAPPSPRPTGPDVPTAAPAPRDVQVEAYAAEGRELTVRFTGGVCADYAVKAAEDAERVTVTVTEKPWPDKVCIMIAKEFHRTVQLDEPVGDRRVVDSGGHGVPLDKPGARLPKTSMAR
ncbi:hypothetical protein [Streptomyces sp. NPDC005017]|uniref:hypothetical protein n=1 Tax=Streptomyces sp. NPDC005017 TaxID=3364706 RepID=UPI0036839D77